MKELNTHACNANIKERQTEIFLIIDSITLAKNVILKQLQKQGLLRTKGKLMKESHTLAGNTTIKLQQRAVLLNTKGRHMKE